MGLNLFCVQKETERIHPVAALSSRMILYPVVLIITRVGAFWIEFAFPADPNQVCHSIAFRL
jgi:hypothetical protein